jgi:hypothetical protein
MRIENEVRMWKKRRSRLALLPGWINFLASDSDVETRVLPSLLPRSLPAVQRCDASESVGGTHAWARREEPVHKGEGAVTILSPRCLNHGVSKWSRVHSRAFSNSEMRI